MLLMGGEQLPLKPPSSLLNCPPRSQLLQISPTPQSFLDFLIYSIEMNVVMK
jgi:hypothetical protein